MYTEFLLGGSAGGLVVFYFFLMRMGSVYPNRSRICVLALAAILWTYTLAQAIRVAMANHRISKLIREDKTYISSLLREVRPILRIRHVQWNRRVPAGRVLFAGHFFVLRDRLTGPRGVPAIR